MPGSSGVAGAARIRLMAHSYLYASPGLASVACRHSVTLLLAVTDEPLLVRWGPRQLQGQVLLVAPMVRRELQAPGVPFVLLDLEPNHSSFRHLALGLAQGGVQAGVQRLQQAQVAGLITLAQGFHAGLAAGPELDERVHAGLAALAAQWPEPEPLDARVAWMIREMNRDPGITLEHLARELSLSATRASRLFSAQMGIPSRAFSMAAKIRAAARFMGSARSLTEVAQAAGFADSAHFAKVWLRCYGGPPSKYFPACRTERDAPGRPGANSWAPPGPAAPAAAWPRSQVA